MDKLIRDGKVAVIVSRGFGAGWSTWTEAQNAFDPDIAQAILDGDRAKALIIAKQKYPDAYLGGLDDGAEVEWVAQGRAFRIDEYDGNEDLVFADEEEWLVA